MAQVYVLFHETNTGRSDDSDGYVEAVYTTEAAAEAARVAGLRLLRGAGAAIYVDPDDPNDEGDPDWSHDLVVLTLDLHEAFDPAQLADLVG